MKRAAEGLMLAVARWETVPPHLMPTGHLVVPIEDDGSCICVIDERYCTRQLQHDMNDLLLRLAGDGLWIQCWFRHRKPPATASQDPLPAPTLIPVALA
ncbi:hypothetical protein [Streptomyces ipomoeae]|uniref:hypothetical protein n=1 Tax=Streptomyces ipomoeae TaxID=103232 RepID=UPI00114658C2|nr:hypothetical protein [Streptomyces ipomoeae]TQE35440.1 hypothetical protein Sipo7851_14355 [Streptomyces ipomoeae]